MVASLRHAATPFAVQSAATSAGQEDHVSMGYEAALRTRRSVALLRAVLAIEVLGAAQAIEMRQPLRPASATGAVIAALRTRTSPLGADRILSGDLEAAEAWARDGEWQGALAGAGVTLR
jgi:histidine ammonia-lyase